MKNISVVIPAKNEGLTIGYVVSELKALYPEAELIVVNDGSTDKTSAIAVEAGAKVINHPYSKGNGASIKSGARVASGEVLVFMDGDGQHQPVDLPGLLEKFDEGYDLVVGARTTASQASWYRGLANRVYNQLASFMTGHRVEDLTSGYRVVRAKFFKRYLYLLPNGFSYPTTSTMAFFRSGCSVGYVPIVAAEREGDSHIKIVRDGVKFLIIIFKIGALFSPMRFFLPISAALFFIGMAYYGYTFISANRFTNMSALLFTSSLSTFLIGIISEQISSLHYKDLDK